MAEPKRRRSSRRRSDRGRRSIVRDAVDLALILRPEPEADGPVGDGVLPVWDKTNGDGNDR